MGQNTVFDEHRSPLHIQCGRVLILAFLPGLIGMVSEYWLTSPDPGGAVGGCSHLGLWSFCANFSSCSSLPSSEFPDAFDPVRGMGLTAMCLHVLSVLVGLICSCEDPDDLLGVNGYIPRLEEICAVVAGLLMGGALGIFAQSSQRHPVYQAYHLDWSFWLAFVYTCILLLSGGVIVLVRYKCACRKMNKLFPFSSRKKRRLSKNKEYNKVHDSDTFKLHDQSVNSERLKDFSVPLTPPSRVESYRNMNLSKCSGQMYNSLEGIPRMIQNGNRNQEEIRVV